MTTPNLTDKLAQEGPELVELDLNDEPEASIGGDEIASELEETVVNFPETNQLPSELTLDDTLTDMDVDLSEDQADEDEVKTKLDLARAYAEMGDSGGAADILDEVLAEGNDQQKQEAQQLKDSIT